MSRHICCFCQDSSFKRHLHLLFKNHDWRTVWLWQDVCQAWLCWAGVVFLLKVLNYFSGLFLVYTILRHYCLLRLLNSRYRLRVSLILWSVLRSLNCGLSDFLFGFCLPNDHLWVLLNLHGNLMSLVVLNSEFLNIELPFVFLWHFSTWNTRVHVVNPVFELRLFFAVNQRHPNRNIKLYSLMVAIKQDKVVTAHINFSSLRFKTVAT